MTIAVSLVQSSILPSIIGTLLGTVCYFPSRGELAMQFQAVCQRCATRVSSSLPFKCLFVVYSEVRGLVMSMLRSVQCVLEADLQGFATRRRRR